ncbi:hypothetical protein QUF90_13000 [Desulfococcaceae bacterium HSG9]|nr:hypothetical protein [Desulfococcaceae bacterium HSG9]
MTLLLRKVITRFYWKKIALLCLFHNSRNPLDQDDYEDIIGRGKTVPAMIYEDADPVKSPLVFADSVFSWTIEEYHRDSGGSAVRNAVSSDR